MTTKFEDCLAVLGDEKLCRKLQRYEQEEQRRKIRTFSEAEEQLVCKSLANRSDWVKVVKAIVNEVLAVEIPKLQAENARLRKRLADLRLMADTLGVVRKSDSGDVDWRTIMHNMNFPQSW